MTLNNAALYKPEEAKQIYMYNINENTAFNTKQYRLDLRHTLGDQSLEKVFTKKRPVNKTRTGESSTVSAIC